MYYGTPYTVPSKYGGTGYGSGSSNSMLRRPSYVKQISSDGYSSAGGSYPNNYAQKYRTSGSDYIPGNPNPYVNSSQPRQTQVYQSSPNYYRDRPNSVAGGVISDYTNKSNYNSGYNSDYGRSGYASGNNSDYGQSGYTSGASDYGQCYSSSKNPSGHYEPLNRRSRPSSVNSKSDMSSLTRSSYTNPTPGRLSSYTRSTASRPSSVIDYAKSRKIASNRNSYTPQTSPYVVSGRSSLGDSRRDSYSRSVSREVSPAKLITASVNNNVHRLTPEGHSKKTKDCKAPADFTSESSSSTEHEEDSDDSPNEDGGNAYVVCRSTSPTQKPPRAEAEQVQSISSAIKVKKCAKNLKSKFSDSATQTCYEDFHPNQKPSNNNNNIADTSISQIKERTRSSRYVSPATTKLSSGYYDRYYNKYTSPISTSRSSSRPSATGVSSRVSYSPSKSELSSTRLNNTSGSKLNLRATSRQNSHEDNKSLPTSPRSPQEHQTNFKLSTSTSGSMNNNNTEAANKEYRKSVLNMNVNENGVEGKLNHSCDKLNERQPQLSKSQSRVANLNKSSQNLSKPQIVEKGSSSSSASTSSDEQVAPYRPPSRTRINSEKATAEPEKQAVSKSSSKSNLDVRNRRGSAKNAQDDHQDRSHRKGSKDGLSVNKRKTSHDGLSDDKRRSSREDLRRRPRSRQASNEDDATSDDSHDNRNGRTSALRRRRRNSKDDSNRLVSKRQGSVEGLVEVLPPRPSRQGSKESILDERPSSKNKLSASSKVNSQNSSRENLLSESEKISVPKSCANQQKKNRSPVPTNVGPGRWIVPPGNNAPTGKTTNGEESSSSENSFPENACRSSPDGIDNHTQNFLTNYSEQKNINRAKSPFNNNNDNKKFHPNAINENKHIGQYKDIDHLLEDEKFQKENRMIVVTAPPNNIHEQDNKQWVEAKKTLGHFIGKCQDIDDVLGTMQIRPSVLALKKNTEEESSEESSSDGEEVEAHVVKVHDSKAQQPQFETYTEEIDSSAVRIRENKGVVPELEIYTEEIDASGVRIKNHPKAMKGNITSKRLEHSCTVQNIPKNHMKQDQFDNRKIVAKQNPQVNSLIDKLSHLEGNDLQQTLFSLKQLFQNDQVLVNDFVKNKGLMYLIRLGFDADSTYQNYILRALGQIMLYVDGMNSVIEHSETIQWLYSLTSSKFRAIAKTALKLLLVFIDFDDSNCHVLINAINSVDSTRGMKPWTNVMMLLNEKESVDMDTLTITTSLINKTLKGISDKGTFLDVVDCVEVQGMERVIQRYMSKQGSDLNLLQQFQIYETVLRQEDGDEEISQSNQILKTCKLKENNCNRRKSFRHSSNQVIITPTRQMVNQNPIKFADSKIKLQTKLPVGSKKSASDSKLNDLNNVTPALRRVREREAQNRLLNKEHEVKDGDSSDKRRIQIEEENRKNREVSRIPCRVNETPKTGLLRKSSELQYNQSQDEDDQIDDEWSSRGDNNLRIISQAEVFDLRRENTVKDIQKKLRTQESLQSPTDTGHLGDFTGLVSKAKEGLNKSSSRTEMKSAVASTGDQQAKRGENDIQWDELRDNLDRPLKIKDMDFTDLSNDDDEDAFYSQKVGRGKGVGPPCPPPLPLIPGAPKPPPPPMMPPMNKSGPPPPPLIIQTPSASQSNSKCIKKNKKTVKLFWKEVSEDHHAVGPNNNKATSIWEELKPVKIDTQILEHLFENRAKDLMNKKQQEMNKNSKIVVLDPKRSNAINIGMTKLPPPRTIKTAILKMDSSIMNREGIEKILTTMMPTEEEKSKILEAQLNHPDVPLGSAEQFLLTLSSITELAARLKLWAFKLDFDVIEKEVAEPLMDLKQGIEDLRKNNTFRCVLATLLSIGNFLNGIEAKGFQIDYLAKVPEVKDTVHKHSLLHHLFLMVMEKFPDTTDLYSEIGAITRAAKVDFDEVDFNLTKLENECKASWDHLKAIAKHDGAASNMKIKMTEFLAECAEQIIILGIIHRRIINRFYKFLIYLGIPPRIAKEMKINYFLKTISEFALEYRTTRERIMQQMEKKICHRERNKTKGKFFVQLAKSKEVQADDELKQLLGCMSDSDDYKWGTMPGVRGRLRKSDVEPPAFNRSSSSRDESMTDGDDEILEYLAKSYRNNPRERRRLRQPTKK